MAQSNSQAPPTPKPAAPQQASVPGSEAPSVSRAKIDPAKEADIRRLLDLTGTASNMLQVMDAMQNNMRPVLTNSLPPGEYREKLVNLFFEKFQSRMKNEIQDMFDAIVPVYDKYFSVEDIKGLIRFYETPLGQKATTELPKLVAELQGQGMKRGEQIGRESMLQVLSEHPELEKALEEAQKAAHPQ
jgi:hypothetical protein